MTNNQLKSYADRIARLTEEKKGITEDIKDIEAEVMEWRVIPGFSGYLVSEHGDVVKRNENRRRRVRPFIDIDGYVRYRLDDEYGKVRTVPAHKAVLLAFVGFPEGEAMEGAHLDGSRLHNHFSNLKWKTRFDNAQDRRVHGTNSEGERNGRAVLKDDDVIEIRVKFREATTRKGRAEVIKTYMDKFGLHWATINSAARGQSWKHVKEGLSYAD